MTDETESNGAPRSWFWNALLIPVRWVRGLPWDSSHRGASFAFELRVLRVALYFAIPLAVAGFIAILEVPNGVYKVWPLPLLPFWVLAGLTLAYYGHLMLRRFQLRLLAFLALVVVWGQGTALVWSAARWEAGLSMFLAFGVVTGFAITWSRAVARVRDMDGRGALLGLFALGLAAPLGLVPALVVIVERYLLHAIKGLRPTWPLWLELLLIAASVAALAPSLWVAHKARRAARRILEEDAQSLPPPDDEPDDESRRRRETAAWLALHKRRWPVAAVAFLCAPALVYMALVCNGIAAAKRNLRESLPAWQALAPPPVPDDANAAVLWKRAAAQAGGWAGMMMGKDWADPKTYAPSSAIRTNLTATAPAYGIMRKAAQRDRCNWGVDYTNPVEYDLSHLSDMRELTRQLLLRARFAAYDKDWKTARESLQTICDLADDLASAPDLVSFLVGVACEGMAVDAIKTALLRLGPETPPGFLDDLQVIARSRFAPLASIEQIMRYEKRQSLAWLDQAASDGMDFSTLYAIYGSVILRANDSIPPLLNVYAIVYPFDRAESVRRLDEAIVDGAAADRGGRLPTFSVPGPERGPHWLYLNLESDLAFHGRSVVWTVRRQAYWRLALAAVAVKRYALTHGGAWPPSLDGLGLSAEERTDPLDPDGGSLKYAIDEDGAARLWSVGPDGGNASGKGEAEYDRYTMRIPRTPQP